jgi:hypothetical protein
LAGLGQVTLYTAELTNVAKYIIQLSEVVQARLAMAKRQNVTTLHYTEQLRI